MKLVSNEEKLKILFLISDQLWDDFKSGEITEVEYTERVDEIRAEMRREFNYSLDYMQNIASKVGYILTKKPKAFGMIKSFKIVKN